MIWLPDYGVGLFAMANLTYAGPGALMSEALGLLHKTGGLQPRQLPVSKALTDTREALLKLWNQWDDAAFASLSADNLALDSPAPDRRKAIEQLKSDFGACRADGPVQPENWLRGKFRLQCDGGTVDIAFTLAPTSPPKVQSLYFLTAAKLDERMRSAASGIISSDQSHGQCKLAETVAGDGKTNARIMLDCDRGPVELRYSLDDHGSPKDVEFARPPQVDCMP